MTEINNIRPMPTPVPTSRPVQSSAADLAVKLLQPLEGLLSSGESAKAEVLSSRETAQSFQLLLKLTLDNGRQATLEATSSRALAQGATVAVTALSETRLALALQNDGSRLLSSLDLEQLPIGTTLQGKVEAREQIAQAKAQQVLYRVVVNLLNTPLAGNKLNIETALPLPVGSLLTAQVRGDQQLAFLPLSGRLDQLALGQQLAGQQSRQGSLDGLFLGLQSASSDPSLPDELRMAMGKLLGLLPDGKQLSTAGGLAKAMEQSGAFFEARLLAGQHGADLKGSLLRLVAQLLPNLPSGSPLAIANAGSNLAQALPAILRNALGPLSQASLRQQAMSFPLPSRLMQSMDEDADLESLLKLAAAAISRLQTHQLASLAQTQALPDGQLLSTWQLELPMRDRENIVPLQIKLQREEPGPSGKAEEKLGTLWRIELAFDLNPLGPLQVHAQLLRGSLSSQMWAERTATAELIERELGHLRERLLAAGLEVGDLSCRQGTPPQGPRTQLEQRWVDETA